MAVWQRALDKNEEKCKWKCKKNLPMLRRARFAADGDDHGRFGMFSKRNSNKKKKLVKNDHSTVE